MFDNVAEYFGMWSSKFEDYYIPSLGCLHVLRTTADTLMVGVMNLSQDELEQRHSPHEIRDARMVYGLPKESMTGYPIIVEFCMQQAMSPSGA